MGKLQQQAANGKVVITMTAAASMRAWQPQGKTIKKKHQSTSDECGDSKWHCLARWSCSEHKR